MKAVLVGPPQSGKTTLLGALTGHPVEHTGAVQEHVASVKVPDSRLDLLIQLCKPKKRVEAAIEFTDVPGFSLSDARGRDDLKRFLPAVRQSDLIVAVVRDFDNPSVPIYGETLDPMRDLRELQTEFLFADLEGVSNRIEKIEQTLAKPIKDKEQYKKELALFERCREALESEKPLSDVIQTDEEHLIARSFGFLTEKPLMVVVNVDESRAAQPAGLEVPYAKAVVALSAEVEMEIAELDAADRQAFLQDLGVDEPAGERLVHTCYRAAGMISFLTYGPDEARAWALPEKTTAVEAAGKVHTDMARGFIRAETVAYEDLKAAGDFRTAKAQAKTRLEGKTYIVQDGDVIHFKFNV